MRNSGLRLLQAGPPSGGGYQPRVGVGRYRLSETRAENTRLSHCMSMKHTRVTHCMLLPLSRDFDLTQRRCSHADK